LTGSWIVRCATAREELGIAQAARAARLPRTREHEHEVHVGGEVELAAAEFAHRDHEEALWRPFVGSRLAVAFDQRALCPRERRRDESVRNGREFREAFLEGAPAAQIAPGDAHELAATCLAQRLHELRLAVAVPLRRDAPLISCAPRARRILRHGGSAIIASARARSGHESAARPDAWRLRRMASRLRSATSRTPGVSHAERPRRNCRDGSQISWDTAVLVTWPLQEWRVFHIRPAFPQACGHEARRRPNCTAVNRPVHSIGRRYRYA
jgi:hypothetical protein